MKILLVEDEIKTGDYLKQGLVRTNSTAKNLTSDTLENYKEDMQDWLEAQTRNNAQDRNLISLDELEKALGH